MALFENLKQVALIIDTLANPGEFAVHYLLKRFTNVLIASPKPKEWWISAERKMGSDISNAEFVDILNIMSQKLEFKPNTCAIIDVSCLLYLGHAPKEIVSFISRLVDLVMAVFME
jgi:hypothetical protein